MKRTILLFCVMFLILHGCTAISPEKLDDCPIKETGKHATLVIIRDDLRMRDPSFCYQKVDGTKVQVDNQKAVESIRSFIHNPQMVAILKAVQTAANGPNNEQVAIYTDQDRNAFEIEMVSYRVTEEHSRYANGLELPMIADSEKLSVDELRDRAEKLMAENIPNFTMMKGRFVYEEAEKSNTVFFFRWSDPTYTNWRHMPPTAQVGFAANGEIVSYLNWLFVVEK